MGTRESEQSSLWVATSELADVAGPSVLHAAECAARRPRLRSIRRRPVPRVLRDGHGPAEPAARALLPVCCCSATSRASTRNAGSPGARPTRWRSARFLRLAVGRGAARSFDDFSHATPDRSGDAPRRVHVGAGNGSSRRAAQGQDDRDRRDHARGERGDAEHRATRHRGELSGVSDAARRRRRASRPRRATTWRGWIASGRRRPRTKTGRTPHDPDAKVAKMKDGRTHLAHKAEHAVDLETGAIVAVTLQGADEGDTTTIVETAIAAAEQVEDAQADVDGAAAAGRDHRRQGVSQ